jgi:hypothetical protein
MSEYQELVRLNTELRNERDSARTRLGAAEKTLETAREAIVDLGRFADLGDKWAQDDPELAVYIRKHNTAVDKLCALAALSEKEATHGCR